MLLLAVLTAFAGYASYKVTTKLADENAADAAWMQKTTHNSKKQVDFNRKRIEAGLPEVKFGPDEQSSGVIPPMEVIPSPSL